MSASQRLLELAESFQDYSDRLVKEFNIKSVGTGNFSEVFQHPKMKNVVVKVFIHDKGYEEYLSWCLKNQKNKFVPKIYKVEQRDAGQTTKINRGITSPLGNTYTFVFMEKLNVAKKSVLLKFLNSLGVIPRLPFQEHHTNLSGLWKDHWGFVAKNSTDKDLRSLARFLSSCAGNLDMHDDNNNVMQRGSDQLVFVDPIY